MKFASTLLILATSFFYRPTDQQAAMEWSSSEIAAADLARVTPGWSENERNTLLHVNLARMYPVKYWNLEISAWEMPERFARKEDSRELASLKATLLSMEPAPPLAPSSGLRTAANCLAVSQSQSESIGHDRPAHCPPYGRGSASAENCSYGMEKGPDVIAQLLIDAGVPSLGHRENCLEPAYQFLGVAQRSHPKYVFVTVMDFSSKK